MDQKISEYGHFLRSATSANKYDAGDKIVLTKAFVNFGTINYIRLCANLNISTLHHFTMLLPYLF